MSCINSNILAGASGAGGGGPLYVDDVFSTFLYKGTGSSLSVNNGIDLAGEGGLTWVKCRTGVENHILVDTERGVSGYALSSNNTNGTYSSSNLVTAFNSNGFTVGANGTTGSNGQDYTSWTFRKAPGFFDVVTWTGNESNPRQIAHNLGSVPGMIIVKSLSTGNWYVYHRSLNNGSNPGNYRLRLELPNPMENGLSTFSATATSTHFTVSTNCNQAKDYVAYVFAHDDASFGTDGDESIIKCGEYTGNGTSASSFNDVSLGFEPQWILIKCISHGTTDWYLADTMRGSFNPGSSYDNMRYLRLNNDQPEGGTKGVEPTPTGFKVRGAFTHTNVNGYTYVYMAIRRPHKPPEVGTDVFAMDTFGGTPPTPPTYYSGFPVDFVLNREINASQDWRASARVTGLTRLRIPANYAELGDTLAKFDQNNGFKDAAGTLTAWQAWMFKRAPGFFDVISYDGTGSNNASINHGLGVVPEMFWIKRRTGSSTWAIYHKDVGAAYSLTFSDADPSPGDIWQDTGVPTSTQFFTHNRAQTNSAGNSYTGYFFATLPGISKVGSYSGYTGYAVNVDCGFTNGARFILIKRTDIVSTGEWYVWDTLRGIVSGNDSYLLLSNQAAEVTNTDYVDPLSTGFTVTASAPAALNVSGGTYIFLAIA